VQKCESKEGLDSFQVAGSQRCETSLVFREPRVQGIKPTEGQSKKEALKEKPENRGRRFVFRGSILRRTRSREMRNEVLRVRNDQFRGIVRADVKSAFNLVGRSDFFAGTVGTVGWLRIVSGKRGRTTAGNLFRRG
jgi:hypothetical protein